MALNNTIVQEYKQTATLTVTSDPFDVAAGDVLVVIANANDQDADANGPVSTISDNQGPDLGWQTNATTPFIKRDDAESNVGFVAAWWAPVTGTITGLTVTVTMSGVEAANGTAIKIHKFNGDVSTSDPIGGSAEGNLTADDQTSAGFTAETAGVGIAAWSDWTATGMPSGASDLTYTGFDIAGVFSGGSGYKTLTSGASNTANMESGGTPDGAYIWFEIREEAGAAFIAARNTPITQAVHRSNYF